MKAHAFIHMAHEYFHSNKFLYIYGKTFYLLDNLEKKSLHRSYWKSEKCVNHCNVIRKFLRQLNETDVKNRWTR